MRRFAARAYTAEHQRLRVRSEDKDAIAAFHWRGAPDEAAAAAAIEEIARRALEEGLAVHWGRKVLEVRPPVALDKGLGVATLLRSPPAPPVGQRPVCRRRHDRSGCLPWPALARSRRRADHRDLRGGELRGSAPELAAEADLEIDGPAGVRGLLQALL